MSRFEHRPTRIVVFIVSFFLLAGGLLCFKGFMGSLSTGVDPPKGSDSFTAREQLQDTFGLPKAMLTALVRSRSGAPLIKTNLSLWQHDGPPYLPIPPRLPFPPGAFRPFFSGGQTNTTSSAEATIGKFGSAFQPPPPTKLGKGSPPSLFSPGQNLFPRSASAGTVIWPTKPKTTPSVN